MSQTAIQLFYWKVEFEDGFELSQFDKDGKEIFVRDFTDEKYKRINKETQQVEVIPNTNVFEKFENDHGRVVKIGWYPFSSNLAKEAMTKQEGLRIAIYPELKAIEQTVPDSYYATHLVKSTEIKYGINTKGKKIEMYPIDLFVSKIHLTIVPRAGGDPITSSFNLRYT